MLSTTGSLGSPGTEAAAVATCLSSLDLIEVSGQLLPVTLDGELFGTGRVFSDAQLARLLRRRTEVLLRWRARGLFPHPVLADATGRRFYADVEACDFIRILGRHQQRSKAFDLENCEVVRRLHECAFLSNRCGAHDWVEVHRAA